MPAMYALLMVPLTARIPDASAPQSPNAFAVRSVSRPSSRAHAAAAPNVFCNPRGSQPLR